MRLIHVSADQPFAQPVGPGGNRQSDCGRRASASHPVCTVTPDQGLEAHFGTRLFQRKSRPLKLSVAGEKLLELARIVIPRVRACEDSLSRLADGIAGRLHIGIECHSCFQWLMPVLDLYREDWPEVELDLTLGHSFEPMPALRSGHVDVVISSDPVADPDLAFFPCLATNPDWW